LNGPLARRASQACKASRPCAHRHGAALAALAQHMGFARLQVDPAARMALATASSPTSSPTRRPQPYSSSTMAASRASSQGSLPASWNSASCTASSTLRALGRGLARLGRAHVLHRVAGHQPLAAQPGVETAPARQHQRDAAAAAPTRMHLATQRRMWAFCTCAQRRPASAAAWALSFCRSSAYSSTVRAPGASRPAHAPDSAGPALPVVARRRAWRACREAVHRHSRVQDGLLRSRTAPRWPARRCAPGSRCPCRCKALRVRRRQHQHAKRGRWRAGRAPRAAASRPARATGRVGQPVTASNPVLTPQKGWSATRQRLGVIAHALAKGLANCGATPQTRWPPGAP
jgi:hypothetical protein